MGAEVGRGGLVDGEMRRDHRPNTGPDPRINLREDVASFSEKNPQTGGGWGGLTALSMGPIGITVLLALSVHALLSVSMGPY